MNRKMENEFILKTTIAYFVKKKKSKISDHYLDNAHELEPRVIEIRSMPLHSDERKLALQNLQIYGNFQHNVKMETVKVRRSARCSVKQKLPDFCYSSDESNKSEPDKTCNSIESEPDKTSDGKTSDVETSDGETSDWRDQ